ncbi:hypothetical protein [Chitinophaga vietnamensis]|uniref:hypothetical protein n=1 Tax=Chitinophaga vietnamensis TaxID=2593957 RepID=UPI0011780E1D|nr:hypothetical protein [Chitinophaga vietnamensis]
MTTRKKTSFILAAGLISSFCLAIACQPQQSQQPKGGYGGSAPDTTTASTTATSKATTHATTVVKDSLIKDSLRKH